MPGGKTLPSCLPREHPPPLPPALSPWLLARTRGPHWLVSMGVIKLCHALAWRARAGRGEPRNLPSR